MCDLLTDMLTSCEPVVGGMVAEVGVASQSDYDTETITANTNTITAITMKAGKYARKFEVMDDETAMLEISGIGQNSAQGLSAKLVINIPNMTPSRLYQITRMINGRHIWWATDKNGYTWQLGNGKSPARMKLTKATMGAKAADPNHAALEITWDSKIGVYAVTAAIPYEPEA